jgi:hypothetical protein
MTQTLSRPFGRGVIYGAIGGFVGGSSVLIGTPAAAPGNASPVILFIQGVGYVELTGIANAGNGQATITYVVLVPTK